MRLKAVDLGFKPFLFRVEFGKFAVQNVFMGRINGFKQDIDFFVNCFEILLKPLDFLDRVSKSCPQLRFDFSLHVSIRIFLS